MAQMVKNLPGKGDPGSIPGWGRSPGEGNGLENPMDRGAWWATVHGVKKGRTRLCNIHFQRQVISGRCTTKNEEHSSLTWTLCWVSAAAHTAHKSTIHTCTPHTDMPDTHTPHTLHTSCTHACHTPHTHIIRAW